MSLKRFQIRDGRTLDDFQDLHDSARFVGRLNAARTTSELRPPRGGWMLIA